MMALRELSFVYLGDKLNVDGGCLSAVTTMDAIFALNVLSEIHYWFNRPLSVTYVELKAAFNSVEGEALWCGL